MAPFSKVQGSVLVHYANGIWRVKVALPEVDGEVRIITLTVLRVLFMLFATHSETPKLSYNGQTY